MFKRQAKQFIFTEEYGEKMRFIAGPRQSGKTTLAQEFLKEKHQEQLYYNWDRREIRDRYYQNSYFYHDDLLAVKGDQPKWLCFDEIHKLPKWKNILKDIFDTDKKNIRLIVTGSARLDLLRKAGDSLAGRYFLFHLFPLTLKETLLPGNSQEKATQPPEKAHAFIEACLATPSYHQTELERLLNFSGFPEPLTQSKENFLRMWRNNYLDTVLKEDLRDLTNITNLEHLARLTAIMPSKIGSSLSINSLINDMEASYPAIKNYLRLLELGYLIFKVPPYSKKIVRAIKKEKKYYLFDWTRIPDLSRRFENYIAFELFSLVTSWQDNGFGDFDLFYVRNRNGQETDFLITREQLPWLLIEVKLNDEGVETHHLKQAEVLGKIPFVQVLYKGKVAKKVSSNAFVVSASRFLA